VNKIKKAWAWVVAALGATVVVLIYYIQRKQRKINALKAKAELADTQKKADLVEVEIKEHLANNATLSKEIDALKDSLNRLADIRKEIASKEKNKTSDEIEDFWNKK
jgi:uncharacterized membrane-anchored protein YhcB (DUF1043 family)